jgi:glycosyltransferase involved in cell wall biosynthesis
MIKPIPSVSVIIAVYNDPIRLRRCLQALERQTYRPDKYEVIVVDNGSDESIEPIVAEFRQARSSSETTQPGPAVARNKGVALSTGKIVAFTDADCIPAPDWIEQGVAKLQSIPNCGIVGGRIQMFFEDPDHPTMAELYDSIMHLNQKLYIEQFGFSATANLFTYKSLFEEAGNFATNLVMSDDKEWSQRVASLGYRLIYADEVLVEHLARSSVHQLRQPERRAVQRKLRVRQKTGRPRFFMIDREFLTGFVPPVLTIRRLKHQYALTFLEQMRILFIWGELKYIDFQERVRMLRHRSKLNNEYQDRIGKRNEE